MSNSSTNPFEKMCTCGYTDWCPGKDDECARTNPVLWETLNTIKPSVPLSKLVAPLLEKFGKI